MVRTLVTGILAALLSMPAHAQSPEPRKAIDAKRFYTGTWLEVARRPMWITDGCPAGTTAYTRTNEPTKIHVKDACRKGSPAGEEKSIRGTGTLLDTASNAKLSVRYNALITREYWIIDRADDYSWFIEASPDFNDLYIFTRRVPSKTLLAKLTARAKALGYDVSRLEFPEQPPR